MMMLALICLIMQFMRQAMFKNNERFEVIIGGSAFTCMIILGIVMAIIELNR